MKRLMLSGLLPKSVISQNSPSPTTMTFTYVLCLARMELIFCIVARMVLYFGFVTTTVLITH